MHFCCFKCFVNIIIYVLLSLLFHSFSLMFCMFFFFFLLCCQKGDFSGKINDKGCLPAGEKWLEQNLISIAGVAVGIAFLQVGPFFHSLLLNSFLLLFVKSNIISCFSRSLAYALPKTCVPTYLHKWPNGIDIAGLQLLSDQQNTMRCSLCIPKNVVFCYLPSCAAFGAEE